MAALASHVMDRPERRSRERKGGTFGERTMEDVYHALQRTREGADTRHKLLDGLGDRINRLLGTPSSNDEPPDKVTPD